MSAVAPAVLGAVVHLAVLATHPAVRAPDHAGPAADHAVDRSGPDWLAELDVPGWAGTGWSGTADRADQGPGRAEPGADHAPDRRRTTVPDQSADDAALAADLRRWAADQPDRPSRNAVMGRYGIDTTRANRLLDGLPPPDAGPAPDHAGPVPEGAYRGPHKPPNRLSARFGGSA